MLASRCPWKPSGSREARRSGPSNGRRQQAIGRRLVPEGGERCPVECRRDGTAKPGIGERRARRVEGQVGRDGLGEGAICGPAGRLEGSETARDLTARRKRLVVELSPVVAAALDPPDRSLGVDPLAEGDRVEPLRPRAAVVRVPLQDRVLAVPHRSAEGVGACSRRGRPGVLADALDDDRRAAGNRAEVRQREPFEEVGRRAHQGEGDAIAVHANAGNMIGPPRAERPNPFDVAEEADPGRARTELGIECALDRVADRGGIEYRVRGRCEAKALANRERVGAPVAGQRRHRRRHLRDEVPAARRRRVRVAEQRRAGGPLGHDRPGHVDEDARRGQQAGSVLWLLTGESSPDTELRRGHAPAGPHRRDAASAWALGAQ